MASAAETPGIKYCADIDLKFNFEEENNIQSYKIDSHYISFVLINRNYEQNNLPIIYLSMIVTEKMYKYINIYKDTATFTLIMKRRGIDDDTVIEKNMLEGEFNYIPSSTAASYNQTLNEDADAEDSRNAENEEGNSPSYMKLLIGLVDKDLVNSLRTSFKGSYSGMSTGTLVTLALEGTDPIIEELDENKSIGSFLMPPVSTRTQFLNYINQQVNLYKTPFRFFMDFDRTYFLSMKGNAVSANDGKPDNVIIDVNDMADEKAFYQGVRITDGDYYIYANPMNVRIITNEAMKDEISNIVVVDEDTGLADLDLDYDESIINAKTVYIRSKNCADYIKNQLELGLSFISVSKANIDGSCLTPNKCYVVKNFGANQEYDGIYVLSYKRDFFKNAAEGFRIVTELGLKSVGKFNESYINGKGERVYTATVNKAVKSTSKRTSTATKRTNTSTTRNQR